MKKCTQCGETKPLSEFWKNSSQKDGLHYSCKTCGKKKGKKWRDKNNRPWGTTDVSAARKKAYEADMVRRYGIEVCEALDSHDPLCDDKNDAREMVALYLEEKR